MGMSTRETLLALGLVAVIAVGAGVVQVPSNVGNLFSGLAPADGGGDDGGDGVSTVSCSGGQTQSATFSAVDIDNPATSLTESANIYQKKGNVGWSSWTQGSEITSLSTGEDYTFVAGISSTDFIDNAYGPVIEKMNLPCIVDETMELYQDDDESGLSSTDFNENDAADTAQALSTGDTATVESRFSATNDEYFGNPYIPEMADAKGVEGPGGGHSAQYPNVVVLELNSSEMDQPDFMRAELPSGEVVELDAVATPGRLSTTSGNDYYAYEAPVITDQDVTFEWGANADDSTDPANDATVHVFAANWYLDSDTAKLKWGVETDDQAAVGTDAAATLTQDFS